MSNLATTIRIINEVIELQKELKELRRWKEEQLLVMSQLDLQAIGKALNLPLGSNVVANILPKILELNQKIERLERSAASP